MKHIHTASIYHQAGKVYVMDDFGNAVALSDDQFDDVLDRHLTALYIKRAGEPC